MENKYTRRGNTQQNNCHSRYCRPQESGIPTLDTKSGGDPRLQASGMTSLFNNGGGFTLIELLVVVLIIGILAAVALPQYQLAVEKSRAAEAISQVKALATAEQIYFLANGEYTNRFSDLDISFENQSTETTDQVNQTNWYVSVRFARSRKEVYAARYGRSQGNGRWYITYDLVNNIMYCSAQSNDTISNKICIIYSDTFINCPWSTSENCYRIP